MEILRTPDERFENLPGYSFDPHYVDDLPGYADLQMHYVDLRPASPTGTVLCLHGQPTWSYLYRKMIPIFAGAGHRVVAPDLFGFGRSDKPTDDGVYTYAFHLESLRQFIVRLDLRDVTLVCQEWGGILGLAIVPGMPERFSRLVVMNTYMPTGKDLGEGFSRWREYNRSRPDLDVGGLLKRSVTHLSDAEAAAYDAPFPDARYKAGVRRFPELVPTDPSMPGVEEWRRAKTFWRRDAHEQMVADMQKFEETTEMLARLAPSQYMFVRRAYAKELRVLVNHLDHAVSHKRFLLGEKHPEEIFRYSVDERGVWRVFEDGRPPEFITKSVFVIGRLRDMDGDNDLDIMVMDNFLAGWFTCGPAGIYYLENQGGDITSPANWVKQTIFQGTIDGTCPCSPTGGGTCSNGIDSYHRAEFLDIDGDGLEDFVTARVHMWYWQWTTQQYVWTEWFEKDGNVPPGDPSYDPTAYTRPEICDGAGFLFNMADVDGDVVPEIKMHPKLLSKLIRKFQQADEP